MNKAFEEVPKSTSNKGKAPCGNCGGWFTIRDMLHSHRQRHMYWSPTAEELRHGKLCIDCTFRTCRDEAIGAGDPSIAPTRDEVAKEVNDIKFKRQGIRMAEFHKAVKVIDEQRKSDRENNILHHDLADTKKVRRAEAINALIGEHLISCCEKKATSSGPSATSRK